MKPQTQFQHTFENEHNNYVTDVPRSGISTVASGGSGCASDWHRAEWCNDYADDHDYALACVLEPDLGDA